MSAASRLTVALLVVALLGAAGFWYVEFSNTDQHDLVVTELTKAAEVATIAPPSPDAEDDFPAIVGSSIRDVDDQTTPLAAHLEIVEVLSHDTSAFTQGLQVHDDRLFESTGLVGRSSIRELDLDTGSVLRAMNVPGVFGEGLTVVDNTAIQLTWRNEVAYRYDIDTFEVLESFDYGGEGWGLCYDGSQLVMSNGSADLQFRNAASFALESTVQVTFAGAAVTQLNELECVDGNVWANIWKSSLIIEIDPTTGNVVTVLNARSLTPPEYDGDTSAVLNGIAYDPSDDTFLLTGKLWPSIYRVRITTQDN